MQNNTAQERPYNCEIPLFWVSRRSQWTQAQIQLCNISADLAKVPQKFVTIRGRRYQYETHSKPLRIPPRATHYIRVNHISEENLERYYVGTSADEAAIEEHLLWCHGCQDTYVETAAFIETIRAALRQPFGSRSGVVRPPQQLQ
jgi:hypothetical protein